VAAAALAGVVACAEAEHGELVLLQAVQTAAPLTSKSYL
jgi:hypothetical protein